VFTSEAGLVARGAVASFGADFYQWGYQNGLLVVKYLNSNRLISLHPELVKSRQRVFNIESAKKFNIVPDSTFRAL
jgi:putative ABC transport system substrate-binding protein